jgi:hypothetical protein
MSERSKLVIVFRVVGSGWSNQNNGKPAFSFGEGDTLKGSQQPLKQSSIT